MEALSYLMPLWTAIIAFCALISLLSVMFHILLDPVKKNQIRLEEELGNFKEEVSTKFDEVNAKIDNIEKLLSSQK